MANGSTATDLTPAQAIRRRWEARYAEGVTPWDTQQTPPEVEAFWARYTLPPTEVALDLGCGPGTNVRYLARKGLTTLGVEIAGAPLLQARHRLQQREPQLASNAHFLCADVCNLPFTNLQAAYILDVGCLHSLPPDLRNGYAASVQRNLAPGGYYHLYAFDIRTESDKDADTNTSPNASGPPGMALGEVAALFTPALMVIEETIARPDRRPCRWYLLQRPS